MCETSPDRSVLISDEPFLLQMYEGTSLFMSPSFEGAAFEECAKDKNGILSFVFFVHHLFIKTFNGGHFAIIASPDQKRRLNVTDS